MNRLTKALDREKICLLCNRLSYAKKPIFLVLFYLWLILMDNLNCVSQAKFLPL